MKRIALVVALVCAAAGSAQAGTVFVSSRAGLGGTDFIDWGQFGPNGTTVGNPISGTTDDGFAFTASSTAGPLRRFDAPLGGAGNYVLGDELLLNSGFAPIVLEFASLVSAVGTQVEKDDGYGAFTVRIEAFDSGGASLGSFTRDGFRSAGPQDGSTIFVGILSSAVDIKRVAFSLTTGTSDHYLNQVDLRRDVTSAAVPLPSAGLLGLVGLALLGAIRLARRERGEFPDRPVA